MGSGSDGSGSGSGSGSMPAPMGTITLDPADFVVANACGGRRRPRQRCTARSTVPQVRRCGADRQRSDERDDLRFDVVGSLPANAIDSSNVSVSIKMLDANGEITHITQVIGLDNAPPSIVVGSSKVRDERADIDRLQHERAGALAHRSRDRRQRGCVPFRLQVRVPDGRDRTDLRYGDLVQSARVAIQVPGRYAWPKARRNIAFARMRVRCWSTGRRSQRPTRLVTRP